MQIKELVKILRGSRYCRKVEIYDCFGITKGYKYLPLYYSDTKKLCFPEKYYSEKEIEEIVKFLEVNCNNEFTFDVEKETYIGGLHTYGWTIRIRSK